MPKKYRDKDIIICFSEKRKAKASDEAALTIKLPEKGEFLNTCELLERSLRKFEFTDVASLIIDNSKAFYYVPEGEKYTLLEYYICIICTHEDAYEEPNWHLPLCEMAHADPSFFNTKLPTINKTPYEYAMSASATFVLNIMEEFENGRIEEDYDPLTVTIGLFKAPQISSSFYSDADTKSTSHDSPVGLCLSDEL